MRGGAIKRAKDYVEKSIQDMHCGALKEAAFYNLDYSGEENSIENSPIFNSGVAKAVVSYLLHRASLSLCQYREDGDKYKKKLRDEGGLIPEVILIKNNIVNTDLESVLDDKKDLFIIYESKSSKHSDAKYGLLSIHKLQDGSFKVYYIDEIHPQIKAQIEDKLKLKILNSNQIKGSDSKDWLVKILKDVVLLGCQDYKKYLECINNDFGHHSDEAIRKNISSELTELLRKKKSRFENELKDLADDSAFLEELRGLLNSIPKETPEAKSYIDLLKNTFTDKTEEDIAKNTVSVELSRKLKEAQEKMRKSYDGNDLEKIKAHVDTESISSDNKQGKLIITEKHPKQMKRLQWLFSFVKNHNDDKKKQQELIAKIKNVLRIDDKYIDIDQLTKYPTKKESKEESHIEVKRVDRKEVKSLNNIRGDNKYYGEVRKDTGALDLQAILEQMVIYDGAPKVSAPNQEKNIIKLGKRDRSSEYSSGSKSQKISENSDKKIEVSSIKDKIKERIKKIDSFFDVNANRFKVASQEKNSSKLGKRDKRQKISENSDKKIEVGDAICLQQIIQGVNNGCDSDDKFSKYRYLNNKEAYNKLSKYRFGKLAPESDKYYEDEEIKLLLEGLKDDKATNIVINDPIQLCDEIYYDLQKERVGSPFTKLSCQSGKILVPINVGANHWLGAIADVNQGNVTKVSYLDSCERAGIERFSRKFRTETDRESESMSLDLDKMMKHLFDIKAEGIEKIAVYQQTNSHDCGPCTITNLLGYSQNEEPKKEDYENARGFHDAKYKELVEKKVASEFNDISNKIQVVEEFSQSMKLDNIEKLNNGYSPTYLKGEIENIRIADRDGRGDVEKRRFYNTREELARYLSVENKKVINNDGDNYNSDLEKTINLIEGQKGDFPLLFQNGASKSYKNLAKDLGIDVENKEGRDALNNMREGNEELSRVGRGISHWQKDDVRLWAEQKRRKNAPQKEGVDSLNKGGENVEMFEGGEDNAYSNINEEELCEAIAVLERANQIVTKGHRLRDTQKVAILLFMESYGSKGHISQIRTGEGKTTIVSFVAALKVLFGEKVDVITSNGVLAVEGVKDKEDFYGLLGISVAHNNPDQNYNEGPRSCYTADVVYGSINNFQFDYLRDRFEKLETFGDRKIEENWVLLDEVDSLLVDQGGNIAKLSSPLPGMESLRYVYINIWKALHKAEEEVARPKIQEFRNNLKQKLAKYKEVKEVEKSVDTAVSEKFKSIDDADKVAKENLEKQKEELKKVEIDSEHKGSLKKEIDSLKIEEKEITKEDLEYKILIEKLKGLNHEEVNQAIKEHENDIYQYQSNLDNHEIESITDKMKSDKGLVDKQLLAHHLHDFVDNALDNWIKNAIAAKYKYEKNKEYKIALQEEEYSIIPVDNANTGVSMKNTVLSYGLHQFLQLKHGLRLTFENLTSSYISNLGYIARYGSKILGLTGTLGSEAERELLGHVYNLSFSEIPTYTPKQFNDWGGHVIEDNKFISVVALASLDEVKEDRAVLIICESIQDANDIEEHIRYWDKEEEEASKKANIRVFTDEAHALGDISITKDELKPRDVVVATNISGRGTDFKTSEELNNNGGLHVIVSFLPCNKRVEDQALGRTARQGKFGGGIIMLRQSELEAIDSSRDMANFEEITKNRDAKEVERVANIKEVKIAELKFKDELFEKFRELYSGLKYAHKLDADPKWQYVLMDLKEKWSFWLEKKNYVGSVEQGLKNTILITSLAGKNGREKAENEFKTFDNDEKVKAIKDGIISHNPFYGSCLASRYLKIEKKEKEAEEQLLNALKIGSDNSVLYPIYTMLYRLKIDSGKQTENALVNIIPLWIVKRLWDYTVNEEYKPEALEYIKKAVEGLEKEVNYLEQVLSNEGDIGRFVNDVESSLIKELEESKKPLPLVKHLESRYRLLALLKQNAADGKNALDVESQARDYTQVTKGMVESMLDQGISDDGDTGVVGRIINGFIPSTEYAKEKEKEKEERKKEQLEENFATCKQSKAELFELQFIGASELTVLKPINKPDEKMWAAVITQVVLGATGMVAALALIPFSAHGAASAFSFSLSILMEGISDLILSVTSGLEFGTTEYWIAKGASLGTSLITSTVFSVPSITGITMRTFTMQMLLPAIIKKLVHIYVIDPILEQAARAVMDKWLAEKIDEIKENTVGCINNKFESTDKLKNATDQNMQDAITFIADKTGSKAAKKGYVGTEWNLMTDGEAAGKGLSQIAENFGESVVIRAAGKCKTYVRIIAQLVILIKQIIKSWVIIENYPDNVYDKFEKVVLFLCQGKNEVQQRDKKIKDGVRDQLIEIINQEIETEFKRAVTEVLKTVGHGLKSGVKHIGKYTYRHVVRRGQWKEHKENYKALREGESAEDNSYQKRQTASDADIRNEFWNTRKEARNERSGFNDLKRAFRGEKLGQEESLLRKGAIKLAAWKKGGQKYEDYKKNRQELRDLKNKDTSQMSSEEKAQHNQDLERVTQERNKAYNDYKEKLKQEFPGGYKALTGRSVREQNELIDDLMRDAASAGSDIGNQSDFNDMEEGGPAITAEEHIEDVFSGKKPAGHFDLEHMAGGLGGLVIQIMKDDGSAEMVSEMKSRGVLDASGNAILLLQDNKDGTKHYKALVKGEDGKNIEIDIPSHGTDDHACGARAILTIKKYDEAKKEGKSANEAEQIAKEHVSNSQNVNAFMADAKKRAHDTKSHYRDGFNAGWQQSRPDLVGGVIGDIDAIKFNPSTRRPGAGDHTIPHAVLSGAVASANAEQLDKFLDIAGWKDDTTIRDKLRANDKLAHKELAEAVSHFEQNMYPQNKVGDEQAPKLDLRGLRSEPATPQQQLLLKQLEAMASSLAVDMNVRANTMPTEKVDRVIAAINLLRNRDLKKAASKKGAHQKSLLRQTAIESFLSYESISLLHLLNLRLTQKLGSGSFVTNSFALPAALYLKEIGYDDGSKKRQSSELTNTLVEFADSSRSNHEQALVKYKQGRNPNKDVALVPLLLPETEQVSHWVGLVLCNEDGIVDITYLDSDNHQLINQVDYKVLSDNNIYIAKAAIEEQRFNDCGAQVIENFMNKLTGFRSTHESAVKVHSLLYENSILDRNIYAARIADNNKFIDFVANGKIGVDGYDVLNITSNEGSRLSKSVLLNNPSVVQSLTQNAIVEPDDNHEADNTIVDNHSQANLSTSLVNNNVVAEELLNQTSENALSVRNANNTASLLPANAVDKSIEELNKHSVDSKEYIVDDSSTGESSHGKQDIDILLNGSNQELEQVRLERGSVIANPEDNIRASADLNNASNQLVAAHIDNINDNSGSADTHNNDENSHLAEGFSNSQDNMNILPLNHNEVGKNFLIKIRDYRLDSIRKIFELYQEINFISKKEAELYEGYNDLFDSIQHEEDHTNKQFAIVSNNYFRSMLDPKLNAQMEWLARSGEILPSLQRALDTGDASIITMDETDKSDQIMHDASEDESIYTDPIILQTQYSYKSEKAVAQEAYREEMSYFSHIKSALSLGAAASLVVCYAIGIKGSAVSALCSLISTTQAMEVGAGDTAILEQSLLQAPFSDELEINFDMDKINMTEDKKTAVDYIMNDGGIEEITIQEQEISMDL